MESVVNFLSRVAPFSLLNTSELSVLAEKIAVEYFPKNTLILRRDTDKAAFLYIVRKGSVRITRGKAGENERLAGVCGEGDIFGASSLLEGEAFIFNAKTDDDVICYLLPKIEFDALLVKHQSLKDFFSSRLSVSLANAYQDGQIGMTTRRNGEDVSLFSNRVRSLLKRSPVVCPPDLSIREAAEIMTLERVGSVIIIDERHQPLGILTDTDMRAKVVARRIESEKSVACVMSAPIITLDAEESVLDALIVMTKHRINHLCVVDKVNGDKFIGVISKHDLILLHGLSPVAAIKSLEKQTTVTGAQATRAQMDSVVDSLIAQGIRAQKLTEMITLFNDKLVEKIIAFAARRLVEEGYSDPKAGYAWMALGSEGRKEQTISTDQDNALVYEETADESDKRYFSALASAVVDDLERCGFPKCKGYIMATNPEWNASVEKWKLCFRKWVHSAEPKALLNASIFMDFRAITGKSGLINELYAYLFEDIPTAKNFLFFMTQNALRTKPPLGFFGGFVVESTGENKHKLNLKERALRPLVDAARIMSLSLSAQETSTAKRLMIARERNLFRESLMDNVIEAFDYIMTLRLLHHSRQRQASQMPDNFINPDDLTAIQRNALKESFRVIEELQAEMRDKFGGGREIQLFE